MIAFIWILLSVIIAFIADSRGRSGIGWFLLSSLLSPVLAIILLLVVRNLKEDEKKEQERKEDRDFQVKQIEALTKKASADELLKLAELKDKGMITDVEFESFKAKLLAQ